MGGISRALISVSDKTGVVDFARGLVAHQVELLSTGGTARLLREAGLPVIEVADYTGFPEMLDGRLKTLHPKIHGGLLARRDDARHQQDMQEQGFPAIDLLCVNLYPFAETIAKEGVGLDEAIEQIDIGGPTMLRAGAKNWQGVTVLVDPADYPLVLQEMHASQGGVGAKLRFRLAAKVFAHTARYDGLIANHLSRHLDSLEEPNDFPQVLTLQLTQKQGLRYGENPHQRAAFYADGSASGLARAQQLQGKELSYNNLSDSDAAVNLVVEFTEPACAIIKHGNPCGAAIGRDAADAFSRAWSADPVSAFGSVIACNRPIDASVAQLLTESFIEVVLAPAIDAEAVAILARKKNLRVLAFGDVAQWRQPGAWDYKRIRGGLLLQEYDDLVEDEAQWRVVSERQPSAADLQDLRFAWKVAKHVRSNAIVYAADGRTLGVGAGQMSRVDAARCGAAKAEELGFSLQGAVLASDAFFPFRDGVDAAAKAGVKAVIQPGGSVRDAEVIASANEHGIAMIFTSVRHFRHG
ncbi:MAG: bifunctional phosphoribosylaminoimidazolecarboxamide formyltransferase/IMP cyclohydrolase [Candidatus Igneacidithiobacillus chanchocoensis]